MKRLHTSAAQPSVFFFVSLLSLPPPLPPSLPPPPPSPFPIFFFPLLTRFTCRMNPFLHGYMYGWLTKLQALLSNHGRFVCSLRDNVGQLPWQLELGLIFILRVDLWVWTARKPFGGIFFLPFFFFFFLPLVLELGIQCFSLYCMCAFLCKHCR